MSIDQIALEALQLPVKDRARLAASLWESIEEPYTLVAGRDDDEAIALALRRDAELETGTVIPLTHETLMQRLS